MYTHTPHACFLIPCSFCIVELQIHHTILCTSFFFHVDGEGERERENHKIEWEGQKVSFDIYTCRKPCHHHPILLVVHHGWPCAI